jgi:transglutaminase-like putative cysteine protease
MVFLSVVLLMQCSSQTHAKTLIMEGELASQISITQHMSFDVVNPVNNLNFSFALPATFNNKIMSQKTDNLSIRIKPEPSSVVDKRDQFGNVFRTVTWDNISDDATISFAFSTQITAELSPMESKASFPVGTVPPGEARFLQPSSMVQSEHSEIAMLAKQLSATSRSESEAVNAILNHVANTVKYTYNPEKYDAVYTLKTKSGNCQNFAHLSMALLRSLGIPSRIVGGISLKEPWKVPVDKSSSLVQSMGQGGHAWIEIFFPDVGWLSYDPQQSKQFTSSRHIKQTHGLDSHDINDSWTALPYLPKYNETIEAKFINDKVALKLTDAAVDPKPYLISNKLVSPKSSFVSTTPVLGKPDLASLNGGKIIPKSGPYTFGNRDFPNLVQTSQVIGNRGERILDKETSAYVTSKSIYAQAIYVDTPLQLETVSLAMHKFGGDGSLYLDLVSDSNGKPNITTGLRSHPVFLDKIALRPGYYWVDFPFASTKGNPVLQKGKYWIILRHSGDAIVNWFYIPGKPYGQGDDTRSTAKGYQWEDILNFDFVFKVKGLIK